MQHFREKLPENRGVSIAKKTCGNFLKLPQLAMTDGQYYGARKLCHNIAAIYCCVCHRPKITATDSKRLWFMKKLSLKQLVHCSLILYEAVIQPVVEYACPVQHSVGTLGHNFSSPKHLPTTKLSI